MPKKEKQKSSWFYLLGSMILLLALVVHLYLNQTVPKDKVALGVDDVKFYAASSSSASLKEAVYIEGEKIFIKSILVGTAAASKETITESLTVFNEDNEIIAFKDNVATGTLNAGDKEASLAFTNRLSSLLPGEYSIALKFKSDKRPEVLTSWQDLTVRPSPDVPFVKSVQYYLDKEHKTKIEPLFAASQPLFVRLKLDGFKKSAGSVSGIVDLKISNSQGDVIASKPRFAAFTQVYDKEKNIVVDGELKLAEPEIYLLSFKISDYFSKKEVTHDEKVVVRYSP